MKFLETLAQQFAGKPIDWDELEHALIRADLGVALTTRIIAKLQEREAWSLLGIQDVIKVAREEIAKILPAKAKSLQPISGKPNVSLVADATTGGNALSQAREFHQALGLTGLIVTKLDGSGKGGIVVAIQDELKISTRFIGTGEKIEDFAPFDPREFVAEML